MVDTSKLLGWRDEEREFTKNSSLLFQIFRDPLTHTPTNFIKVFLNDISEVKLTQPTTLSTIYGLVQSVWKNILAKTYLLK